MRYHSPSRSPWKSKRPFDTIYGGRLTAGDVFFEEAAVPTPNLLSRYISTLRFIDEFQWFLIALSDLVTDIDPCDFIDRQVSRASLLVSTLRPYYHYHELTVREEPLQSLPIDCPSPGASQELAGLQTQTKVPC